MRVDEILNRFKNQKILVVGDIMLDRYVLGGVERISPEGPVPVLKVREEIETPGGAGNVALNLRTLGASVELVGTVGKDREGKELIEALAHNGIRTGGIVRDKTKPTTSKTRLIAGNQQIARIDKETNTSVSMSVEKTLIDAIKSSVNNFKPKAIIISDYAKGVVTENVASKTMKLAKEAGIFITVDPKGDNFTKYSGASAITPNEKEAGAASGVKIVDEESLKEAANTLIRITEADFVLVTRGKEGISYFSKKGDAGTIPSQAVEVFDVTGAGDTVVSVFTLSFISSYLLEESAGIANAAAGIVVSRIGAASISVSDLTAHFLKEAEKERSKIYKRKELSGVLSGLRAKGKKVIFTNGCFDLFHTGHLKLLREARKLGDSLVVAINSDDSVKRLKGEGRPYISETDRANLLTAIDCVDFLAVFEEDTPLEIIKELKPDVIVKGGDYSPEEVVGKEFIENRGGEVKIIPLIDGISTSSLAERIKNSGE
ncbi:MAG: D-glycero-beta-D-manno-heptose-7-phosphate kinase [Deltaproteobacteria bacterium]